MEACHGAATIPADSTGSTGSAQGVRHPGRPDRGCVVSASDDQPAPAPGQRWKSRASQLAYSTEDREPDGRLAARFPDGSVGFYRDAEISRDIYLGPSPSPATPAAPADLPRHGAAGVSPPAGYVACRKKCGRWTYAWPNLDTTCWECHFARFPSARSYPDLARKLAEHPDWAPDSRLPVAEARGADDTRKATPSPEPMTAVREARRPEPGLRAQPGEGDEVVPPSASPANVGMRINDFSREVSWKLEARARERAYRERPFVPSVDEWDLLPDVRPGLPPSEAAAVIGEDLFGRPVRS